MPIEIDRDALSVEIRSFEGISTARSMLNKTTNVVHQSRERERERSTYRSRGVSRSTTDVFAFVFDRKGGVE